LYIKELHGDLIFLFYIMVYNEDMFSVSV